MKDIRLEKLADLLVNYSTQVKQGDKVYIRAEYIAMPYIVEVAKAAIRNGGNVHYVVEIPEITEYILKNGNETQIATPDELWGKCVRDADVWLTAWGSINTRKNSNIDSKKLQLRQLGNRENRLIYSSRMSSGQLRWCGTQFPTNAEAQEADMSLSEYENFVYGAGLIDSENPIEKWKAISLKQQKWVDYLNTKKMLHIVSKNTDLKVNVEGRKWINCDGKENFPDGEVFTSPVETDINGHINFSFPAIYNGKMVEDVFLEIKDGKVINAKAEKGNEFLHSCLETDSGSCYFGEVAIGTNYGIKKFTKNILFDEKIGGTIHMALGDSMMEAGGKNKSAIHWDMICDMRTDGEIYADGQLFYKNGEFLDDVLNYS